MQENISNNMIREEKRLIENPELIPKKVSLVIKKFKVNNERMDEKRKCIENLHKSNKSLEQTLVDIASTSNCVKEQEQAKTITLLLNKMDNIDNQLKTEKEYMRDLQHQIHQAECKKLKITKITVTRKGLAKQVLDDDAGKLEKSKEVWNEKLHVASCNLSNELTKNSALRETIQSLLSERKYFNKEYNKLIEKLENGKKIMEQLTASIKNVSHLRKNVINKIENIHLKEKKQMKLQDEEAQDLEMKKECEVNWKKFYLKKSKLRGIHQTSSKKMFSTGSLEDKLEDHKWLTQQIIETYCEDGESKMFMDYNDIIRTIKKHDNDVVALINFVTQQNSEIQVVRERVLNQGKKYDEISLQEEENQFIHELQKRNLQSHKETLEELRLNIYDDKRGQQKVLNKLYTGIQNLVDITEAEVSPLLLLLGDNGLINDFNYTLFLQAVETKIINFFEAFNMPRSNLALIIMAAKEKDSSKTGESQKSYRRVPDCMEDKKTITIPCQQCFTAKI